MILRGTCKIFWVSVPRYYFRLTRLTGGKKMLLVGGWTTQLKNMLVKLDHFPKDRGENKNIWNHHLDWRFHQKSGRSCELRIPEGFFSGIFFASPTTFTFQDITFTFHLYKCQLSSLWQKSSPFVGTFLGGGYHDPTFWPCFSWLEAALQGRFVWWKIFGLTAGWWGNSPSPFFGWQKKLCRAEEWSFSTKKWQGYTLPETNQNAPEK